jgi:hypothetical protein
MCNIYKNKNIKTYTYLKMDVIPFVTLSGISMYYAYLFAKSDFTYLNLLSKIDLNALSDVNKFYKFMIFLLTSIISIFILYNLF